MILNLPFILQARARPSLAACHGGPRGVFDRGSRVVADARAVALPPARAQAFVGLFKPLFPKAVQAKLRFDKAPYLSKLGELTPLTKDAATRKGFLNEVANLLDDGFYGTKSRM